ncbi:molybdopterin-guanine dinucleotide biosynthesis protein B [Methylocella silvestris]|uniref:Molybdopterin-guanine dinucleotide biosynthesis protein B n=2 Tax=Methylocella silvestris TaxID=199596 RepID=A0A2J7TJL2_METSI|nr:molybdopterin-guanine dinucleotide biosynthesis protein B [Methylocella silvestris]
MRVIGLSGWSGAGKTTLIVKLIPHLIARGVHVSTLKHAHHAFDIDQPGKDSYRHREAGASEVLIASGKRFALMHEIRDCREPPLSELLARLSPVDLVLIEGFKRDAHVKIEVSRAANAKPPLFPDDPGIVAVISDDPAGAGPLPHADLDDIAAAADLVLRFAEPVEATLAALARGGAPESGR